MSGEAGDAFLGTLLGLFLFFKLSGVDSIEFKVF
jgi:hypothetical protein